VIRSLLAVVRRYSFRKIQRSCLLAIDVRTDSNAAACLCANDPPTFRFALELSPDQYHQLRIRAQLVVR